MVKFLHLDNFYNSFINIGLWGIITVLLIVSVFTGAVKTTSQKIIHIVLALIFIVIVYEKTVNNRFYLKLAEGETIQFADYTPGKSHQDSLTINLKKFEINRHPGSRMPRAFISHLVMNESDTVHLAVNDPLSFRHYRFYQNAYDRKFTFNVRVDQQEFSASLPDTFNINSSSLILKNFDHQTRKFVLIFNNTKHRITPGKTVDIEGHQITINPKGAKFISIIEVAEVKGVGILLILSLVYLLFLYIAFRKGDRK
ncbi:MAG: cytochrome c biogenesis protein ResB [Candidatus Marinimicrobia bacterium]|nr:cytochrome c biogenesis protein ResB [Candidatus Neomarinimicrobiota bacterium]